MGKVTVDMERIRNAILARSLPIPPREEWERFYENEWEDNYEIAWDDWDKWDEYDLAGELRPDEWDGLEEFLEW